MADRKKRTKCHGFRSRLDMPKLQVITYNKLRNAYYTKYSAFTANTASFFSQ